MPATGLQDVKQKIGVDYDDGYRKIYEDAMLFAAGARESRNALKEYLISAEDANRAQVELRSNMELLQGVFRDADKSVEDHIDRIDRLQQGYAQIADASKSLRELTSAISETGDATYSSISRGQTALEGYKSKLASVRDEVNATHYAITRLQESAPKGVDFGVGFGDYAPGSRETVGLGPVVEGLLRAHEADSTRFSSIIPALVTGGGIAAAMALLNRPGAMGAVRGAAGAVGGGLAAAGGWAASGLGVGRTAEEAFAPVGGFLARWAPIAHYAIMGVNEALATVGPALVAVGAAATVGGQGVEEAIPRYQALRAVNESLGDSLGKTQGQFIGMGDAVQTAQDKANGGIWEIYGAGINSLKNNTKGFLDMGTNTVAMLDTFTAKATIALQAGGGKQLQDVVKQGTTYLKQFGDIAGNLGLTFLHLAPSLPGVGGDLLSTLQGATRGLANVSGAIPSPILGTLLAGEAGVRLGMPLMGAASGVVEGLGGAISGIPGLGRVGLGVAAAGTGMGMLTAPVLAALAGSAYLIGKTATAQDANQQHIGQLQGQINQSMVGAQGLNTILGSMNQVGPTGGPQHMSYFPSVGKAYKDVFSSHFFKGLQEVFQTGWGSLGGIFQGPHTTAGDLPTDAAINSGALAHMATQFNQVLDAGTKVSKMMGVSIPDAFGLTSQAMLQVGNAFDKHGNLTAAAQQQIKNLQAGYFAMNTTTGVFGKNVAAVNTQLGLQHTQVAQVNSGWDQFVGNAVSGAVGTANLNQALQTAHPVIKQVAKELNSFSPQSAAAWNLFASTSTSTPGLLQQSNALADQIRIDQTSGALGGGQAAGMTAYLAKQLLPYGKDSKAALAAVGILGQQAGLDTVIDPHKNQAQNYAAISKAIDKAAVSQKQYNAGQVAATVGMSDVSAQATHFTQTMQGDVVNALASGSVNVKKISGDMQSFSGSLHKGAAGFNAAAMKSVFNDITQGGGNAASAMAILDQRMHSAGVAASGISKANTQIRELAKVSVQVTGKNAVDELKTALAGLHGKNVSVNVSANSGAVNALKNAIAGVHGKSVTVTVTTINRMITQTIGAMGTPGGVAPMTLVGGPAGMRITSHATGGLIPGTGSGDTYPAMLTPGEAVVPRNLVPMIAPFLAAHKVPGFGGVPSSGGGHFATGGIVPSGMSLAEIKARISESWKTLDALYSEKDSASGANRTRISGEISAFWKTVLDPLYAQEDKLKGKATSATSSALGNIAKEFTISLSGQIAKEVKNSSSAKTIASALMSKIQQEISYAKSTASAMKSGLNLGGMDVTQGSVADQMQSYATSLQAFSKDISALHKGGLNKDLIKQIVAAGPVQGDALAQSILTGGGTSGSGIKDVNKLYAQIGRLSNAVGAQAAAAQYGGKLSPNLKSGTFVSNNVSISIGGQGSSGLGDLTDKQINALVAIIQKKLLQQAQRNRKTGVKLQNRDT